MSVKKADVMTADTANWNRFTVKEIERIDAAVRKWAGAYQVDADDLTQELILHLAAREDSVRPWWAAKTIAHAMRERMNVEESMFVLLEEGEIPGV